APARAADDRRGIDGADRRAAGGAHRRLQEIHGHASGTARDSEDTLDFSVLTDVKPMIETMPLEQAGQAYDKMISGDARFRMVLTTGA
ncbi:MAG: hypothetical protein ACXVRN_07650, partial [Solirubrobacteraceae bacterium]